MSRRLLIVLTATLIARTTFATTQPSPRDSASILAMIDRAPEGARVLVPPGQYSGHLHIGKTVSLDGGGLVTIDGGADGTVVEISAPGVTFSGFTVRGSGTRVEREPAGIRATAPGVTIEDCVLEDVLFGIDLKGAANSRVQRNTISGKDLEPGRRGDGIRLWWSPDCTVQDNRVSGSRDMVFWYSENLTVRRNEVTHSRYGLHFMYSHSTTLTGNVLRYNSVGIYLMYSNNITLTGNTLISNRGSSGYGIGLKDCDNIVLQSNALLANRVGAYIDNSPSSVGSTGIVRDNFIAYNEIGILLTPNTHDNVISGNGFIENEEQAGVHGRGDLTLNRFSHQGRGNYWSDYAGFDQDADGIGDLEYRAASLFESLLAREPSLRLLVHSPAQQAIEFTARALPEMRPDPKFIDPSPLMKPPSVEVTALLSSSPRGMALSAAGLLLAGAGALSLFGRSPRLPHPAAIAGRESR